MSQLTYGGLLYWDRSLNLAAAAREVAGLDLAVEYFDNPAELFRQQARSPNYDISEMSLATYIGMIGQGDDRLVGLPIFPSRNFRHSDMFVTRASGVQNPRELVGASVGVPQYFMTATLWQRGMLKHEYGVEAEDLEWVIGGLRTPGHVERYSIEPPEKVRIRYLEADTSLERALYEEKLDALLTVTPPSPPPGADPRAVRQLFNDVEAVETAYFERTRLFPIMHLVTVKREIYEKNPELARGILDAFCAVKSIGIERLAYTSCLAVSLPMLKHDLLRRKKLFGPDPFPYGIHANRHALGTALQYAHEQGLTQNRLVIDRLFPPELLST